MKLILIIIFHISFISYGQILSLTQGQEKEIDIDYEIQGIFKDFENFNFEKSLINKKLELSVISDFGTETIIKRKLEFNYSQEIYTAKFTYAVLNKGMHFKFYQIIILKENDTIIGLINLDKYRKKINYYVNYSKIQNYIMQHNSFYNEDSNIDDLIKEMSIIKDYCYSNLLKDKYPASFYYIPKEDKSIEFTKNGLKSYSPEERVFSAYALNYLFIKNTIKLSQEELNMLDLVKKQDLIIKNCGVFNNINIY